MPTKFFNPLTNTEEIWEIRVITTFKNIRILCFFDDEDMVVLTHGFIKKTQKTPRKEIKKAEKIKIEYLENKWMQ